MVPASVEMMLVATGMISGRLVLIALTMDDSMFFPVSASRGMRSCSIVAIFSMPAVISAVPLSESPLNSAVSPSMTDVIPGRNSATMLFFMPVVD